MLDYLKKLASWFVPAVATDRTEKILPDGEASDYLSAPGVGDFALAACLHYVSGLPVPDWAALERWLESVPDAGDRAAGRIAAEFAWMRHLRKALGPRYRLAESEGSLVLSSLGDTEVLALLRFMDKSGRHIVRILDGIARPRAVGKNLLLVFETEDDYYRYVLRYYPPEGLFGASSGMHIDAGCSHFVTRKTDLLVMEPVIAHEMTHAYLAHLPLPAWLNEGLAVNTEYRLCPPPRDAAHALDVVHRRFWGEAEIQQFWSGWSFKRSDEGSQLSYDLARIMVALFAKQDWAAFRSFVNEADAADAGLAAARRHLGVELGDSAAALVGRGPDASWRPAPRFWRPE